MKLKNILLVLMLLTSLRLSAQTRQDVIYLKNGEAVRGEIVGHEYRSFNAPVQIRTADGSVLTFPIDEVDMVKYAERESVVSQMSTAERRKLTEIIIPNSVTEIDSGAFYGCSGLTHVTIPNSVTTIGWYAFYGCSGLENITCLTPEPPKCYIGTFDNVPTSTCTLYVPKGAKETYSKAKGWKSFKHIVEME